MGDTLGVRYPLLRVGFARFRETTDGRGFEERGDIMSEKRLFPVALVVKEFQGKPP